MYLETLSPFTKVVRLPEENLFAGGSRALSCDTFLHHAGMANKSQMMQLFKFIHQSG